MSHRGPHDQNLRRPTTARGDLGIATRAATGLAYAVALAGATGATLALRDGALVDALVLLVVTLAVAALLAAVSTLLAALQRIEGRLARLEVPDPGRDPSGAAGGGARPPG
jgi:hypothetical protein